MNLTSKKVCVQKSAQGLFDFLCDVKNFKIIMPDTISKFEVIKENAFIFALKGMPEIALEVKEVNKPTYVKLGAMSDKIPFTLIGDIEEIDDKSSYITLKFEGDFNPMMAMMIKGPITKFLESLSNNLEAL